MIPSFGTRLRLQREQRSVPLSAIAAETKIKISLLEGLERDDVSHWPLGIFRRAYVRSYAQAIGLDPAEVLREFLELYPDPDELPPAAAEGEPEAPLPSPNRLRRLVTSAIAAVPALQHVKGRVAAATAAPPPREYVVRDDAFEVPPSAVPADGMEPADLQPAFAEPDRPSASGVSLAHARDVSRAEAAADGFDEEEFVLVPPEVSAAADTSLAEECREPRLEDAARLCSRLAQVVHRSDLTPVLVDAASVLDAVGLIVWSWDARADALRPTLAHGYSDSVLARLPVIGSEGENAIAAAFRSREACVVNGNGDVTGAAVIPLVGPEGCIGVLALELRNRGEQRESVRALATVLAAQLVTLLGPAPAAQAATA